MPAAAKKAERNCRLRMRKSLTKKERLRRKGDISLLFSSAESVTVKGMKLLYRKNGDSFNRILVTLIRKYGNAVQRNRAKRVLREIYRTMKHELSPGYDLGFILYPGEYDYRARNKQCRSLLKQAGLITWISFWNLYSIFYFSLLKRIKSSFLRFCLHHAGSIRHVPAMLLKHCRNTVRERGVCFL